MILVNEHFIVQSNAQCPGCAGNFVLLTRLLGKVLILRESSFNMTREDEDIEGGLRKFLDTRKGGSEKIRGAPKICILQNQQEGGY